ncbi:MAG: hypothetical protein ILP10_07970, partial [Lachnospiraceae bacterium]|nr:hypothetical protein [Lachnospiraceae bacterium]
MKKHKSLIVQILFVVAIIVIWQITYNSGKFPELVFPSIGQIFDGLVSGFRDNDLLGMVGHSMRLILEGLGIGIVLAFILSGLSIASKTFFAVYNMVVSVCDLLPGVAL